MNQKKKKKDHFTVGNTKAPATWQLWQDPLKSVGNQPVLKGAIAPVP